MRIETASAPETESAGARSAARLRAGDVVLVRGELGAGKTTFIRGACRALGVEEPVTSPTFTLAQLYRGRSVEVAHVDLYRLTDAAADDLMFLDDYVGPGRVAFVEWPELAAPRFAPVVVGVRIQHAGGDRRVIDVT